MNTKSQFIILVISLIVFIALLVLLRALLFRKIRHMLKAPNFSTGIFVAVVLFVLASVLSKVVELMEAAYKILNQTNPSVTEFWEAFALRSSLLLSSGLLWFLLIYYFAMLSTRIITGKLNLKEQLENDYAGYSLIRGAMLLGASQLTADIFSRIAVQLLPVIDVPFYR